MNILITGARGFIGNHLINQIEGKIIAISREEHPSEKNLTWIKGDITDRNFVSEIMKTVEVVIHMAAILNPRSKDIYRVNVNATKILVEEAEKNNLKKFIYLSTENALYDFKDNYTLSKKKAEDIVKKFRNHLIIRPTIIYGKGDFRYLFKIINVNKKFPFIPLIGNAEFQPIYVGDVVSGIKLSIKKNITGTYIFAGPSKLNLKTFIRKIQLLTNERKSIIKIPKQILKPPVFLYQKIVKNPAITSSQIDNANTDRIYDITKTLKTFDYEPTDIDSGLKKSIGVFE